MGDISPIRDPLLYKGSSPKNFLSLTERIHRATHSAFSSLSALFSPRSTHRKQMQPLTGAEPLSAPPLFPKSLEKPSGFETYYRKLNNSLFGLQQQLYFHMYSGIARICDKGFFGGKLEGSTPSLCLFSLEDHLRSFKAKMGKGLSAHQQAVIDAAMKQLTLARKLADKLFIVDMTGPVEKNMARPLILIKQRGFPGIEAAKEKYNSELASQIHAMVQGESRIFSATFARAGGGHAVLFQIVKEKDSSYTLALFNTGIISYHRNHKLAEHKSYPKYYPMVVAGAKSESIISFLSVKNEAYPATGFSEDDFYKKLENLGQVPLYAGNSADKLNMLEISKDDNQRSALIYFLRGSAGRELKQVLSELDKKGWHPDIVEVVNAPLPKPYRSQSCVGNCAYKSISVWLHQTLGASLYRQFKTDMIQRDFEALQMLLKGPSKTTLYSYLADLADRVYGFATGARLRPITDRQTLTSTESAELVDEVSKYLKSRAS